jgi:hypothetical protein
VDCCVVFIYFSLNALTPKSKIKKKF